MSGIGRLAEQFGASEALIERSVEARAAAAGRSPEEVLQDWTGDEPDSPPATAPDASTEAPVAAPSADAEAETGRADAQAPPHPEADVPETQEPAADVVPEPATAAADGSETESTVTETQTTVEPVARRLSPWMVAALLLIPLMGVLYLAINPNGVACGEGGSLAVAFDGSIVNCDGTPFEGRGGGGAEAVALLGLGQEVYSVGGQCASCHGANGQGGTGPAMAGGAVLVTWPSCEDQVRWVELGSDEWSASVGSSYGAQDKPVQGGMPGYAGELSDEELRAVVAFERIRFGGAPAEETLIECGLITPEEESPASTEG